MFSSTIPVLVQFLNDTPRTATEERGLDSKGDTPRCKIVCNQNDWGILESYINGNVMN